MTVSLCCLMSELRKVWRVYKSCITCQQGRGEKGYSRARCKRGTVACTLLTNAGVLLQLAPWPLQGKHFPFFSYLRCNAIDVLLGKHVPMINRQHFFRKRLKWLQGKLYLGPKFEIRTCQEMRSGDMGKIDTIRWKMNAYCWELSVWICLSLNLWESFFHSSLWKRPAAVDLGQNGHQSQDMLRSIWRCPQFSIIFLFRKFGSKDVQPKAVSFLHCTLCHTELFGSYIYWEVSNK